MASDPFGRPADPQSQPRVSSFPPPPTGAQLRLPPNAPFHPQRSSSAQRSFPPTLPVHASSARSASQPTRFIPNRQDDHPFTPATDQPKPHSPVPPPLHHDLATRTRPDGFVPRSPKLKITDFELMKTLGTGTFARVWLARFAHSEGQDRNRVFALKVLRKADVIRLKQVEHVRNERNVLAAVAGYPFITALVTSFADAHSLYMLLDYTAGGEIFSYLRRARRFPLTTVQFYAAEIALILAYLHDHVHVAYRDLKPENILLDADGHLKLVDFGFAKFLPPAPPGGSSGQGGGVGPDRHGRGVTYTLCGTPEYLAPEVIRNQGHGMAVDWWALGILVYEMLLGQPPFWDPNPMRIYEQILAGHIRFPSTCSCTAADHPSASISCTCPSTTTTTTTTTTSSTPSVSTAPTPTPPLPPPPPPPAPPPPPPSTHVPISPQSKSFILALCTTDPAQRLGHIAGGSARVMSHPFFAGVDWEALYYRKVPGPIVPKVDWAGDAGNFDDYPDPDPDLDVGLEAGGGGAVYTSEMRDKYEEAFANF